MIHITRVQIHLHNNPDSVVKAFADIIIEDDFIVRNLVVLKMDDGTYHVNMPNRMRNGLRQDVAHPLTEDCRRYIEDMALDEYDLTINKNQG